MSTKCDVCKIDLVETGKKYYTLTWTRRREEGPTFTHLYEDVTEDHPMEHWPCVCEDCFQEGVSVRAAYQLVTIDKEEGDDVITSGKGSLVSYPTDDIHDARREHWLGLKEEYEESKKQPDPSQREEEFDSILQEIWDVQKLYLQEEDLKK